MTTTITITHALVCAVPLGAGATLVMDAWMIVRTRVLGIPAPDYAMVGRWLGHLPRLQHARIAAASPVRGERVLGWAFHYLTGVAFAALLLFVAGDAWLRHPAPGPALAVGIGTVLAPFLILQPGLGAGLCARRAPRPGAARLQALVTHAVFGLGLYVSGLVASVLCA